MTEPQSIGAARILAPEDIAPGQYVATLYRVYEIPARPCDFELDASCKSQDIGTLRYRVMISDGPYRVLDVCLPVVLVEDLNGCREQLDVRDTTIAQLSQSYGDRAFRKDTNSGDEPDWTSLREVVAKHLGAK